MAVIRMASKKAEPTTIDTGETAPVKNDVTNGHVKDYTQFNLENLENGRVGGNSKRPGKGCLTIINHDKCGKRLLVENKLWRALGCPQFVSLSLADEDLIVQPADDSGVPVRFNSALDYEEAEKNYKNKIVLYAANAAETLAERWHLKNGCSFTGGSYSIIDLHGTKAAAIVFTHTMDVKTDEVQAEFNE